ncbi:hypothetical protein PInf_024874 [Phytophthora infestans]|nr:hypothetical protein PInf_024874 [Phytophthora infestans]
MDLGSDIASDSEDDSVSTSDSEYAATSPSLPEGEEGGWNQDSDQEVSFGLSVDSRNLGRQKCWEEKEDEIERFTTSVVAMTYVKKKTIISTALAVAMGAGVPVRRRGDGSGDYKFIVEGMYKKVKSIQEYPLLKMWSVFPGVVKCHHYWSTDEDRGAAVADVLAVASMKTTSEETDMPYSTLKEYVVAARKGSPQEPKRRGPPPLLPRDVEDTGC